MIIKLY